MKMKHLKFVCVCAGFLVLAGCADNEFPDTAKHGMYGSNAPAKTYAMGQSQGLEGQQIAGTDQAAYQSNNAGDNETYYFAFDSTQLTPEALQQINAQATYLTQHPTAKLRLEGNTDNRGSREYNIGLGYRRDQAVEQKFQQLGISPKRVAMVSYGKEKPAVQGDNEEAWRLNRRVNLVYEAK